MKNKLFIWFDSSNGQFCYGPHYFGDVERIGKKLYHTLEDMLKMNISDVLKLRFANCKFGTCIKIHYLHSNGNLMVKCISEDKLEFLNEYLKIDNEISTAYKTIDKLKIQKGLTQMNILKDEK